MRGAVGAALLALSAWAVVSIGDGTAIRSKSPIPLKIVGTEGGKTWAQTVYPPLMSFRVRSGQVPEKGTVQLCTVVTDKRPVGAELINTISLHCEEGLVMELEGIDLGGGQGQ